MKQKPLCFDELIINYVSDNLLVFNSTMCQLQQLVYHVSQVVVIKL